MKAEEIARLTEKHVRPNSFEFEEMIKQYAKEKVDEKTDAIKNQFCLGYHPEPIDQFEWDEEAVKKIDNAPEPEFD